VNRATNVNRNRGASVNGSNRCSNAASELRVAFSAAQWLLARRSALSSQRLPRQERALHLRVHSEDAGRPRLIAGLVSPDAETLYRIIAIPLTIRHLQLCFADDAAPTKAN
jgi:hypothetical protein